MNLCSLSKCKSATLSVCDAGVTGGVRLRCLLFKVQPLSFRAQPFPAPLHVWVDRTIQIMTKNSHTGRKEGCVVPPPFCFLCQNYVAKEKVQPKAGLGWGGGGGEGGRRRWRREACDAASSAALCSRPNKRRLSVTPSASGGRRPQGTATKEFSFLPMLGRTYES